MIIKNDEKELEVNELHQEKMMDIMVTEDYIAYQKKRKGKRLNT